ncbi:hypothetical protein BJV74DRAFT_798325 [Russula compacta]|nr:hypothetical protein BJV74DRAFT_798325 [Russula compacta]
MASPAISLVLRPTPQVHRTLALHILRAAQGTRVSDHRGPLTRVSTSQVQRTLPVLPLAITSSCSSRRHACTRQRTGPALSSDLDGSARSNSQYVPPMTLLSLDSSDPDALICAAGAPHRIQPLRLPTCSPNNPGGEHIALCSTPQGTTIQGCLSPHGSVATCRGVLAQQTDSSSNCIIVEVRQGQLHKQEASEFVGPTVREQLLVRQWYSAPICVGWGRNWGWVNVLGSGPKVRRESFISDPRYQMHAVQGGLEAKQHPHTPLGNAVARPLSFQLHASLNPIATKPCELSNVRRRFQAPFLEPPAVPPAAERSRGAFFLDLARDPASFRHRLPRCSPSHLPDEYARSTGFCGGGRCESIKHQGPEGVHDGGLNTNDGSVQVWGEGRSKWKARAQLSLFQMPVEDIDEQWGGKAKSVKGLREGM